jgi:hypothetical protein
MLCLCAESEGQRQERSKVNKQGTKYPVSIPPPRVVRDHAHATGRAFEGHKQDAHNGEEKADCRACQELKRKMVK